MLGCTHRHLTSPVMRAAVLAMSGTRQKYHCGSVPVMAFDPAKRSYLYSKIARIMYYSPTNFSQKCVYFTFCCNESSWRTAHGTACPSQAKQSNVFILLGMNFSMCIEEKTPSLISRKNIHFNNQS